MIYQRQSELIIRGNNFHKFEISRNIKSGYKCYHDNQILLSSCKCDENVDDDMVEWAINMERSSNLFSIKHDYLDMLRKIETTYKNHLENFILRRKLETLCVNDKKSFLEKYEVKAKFSTDAENYFVCTGGTGTLTDIINKTCFWTQLSEKEKFYNLPYCNFKYTGVMKVLFSNQATGFLCHEAIGHMAECDLIEKGSAFRDKLGQNLFDKRICVVDSGRTDYGAGNICFDEEGTDARNTYIIKSGRLNSYLTDNESAKRYHLLNTGNRRSGNWRQLSNIRMTNTYMESGKDSVEDIRGTINFGVYIYSIVSGDCYIDGNFTIRAKEACLIKNGKTQGRFHNVIVNENVFNILNRVYAIGDDSKLCLGCSSCGKGGNIKVDAGGPHILVDANVKINDRYN